MYLRRVSSSFSLTGRILHTVFSINLTNQIRISTLHMLKQVWNAESWNDTNEPSPLSVTPIQFSTIHVTIFVNGPKRQSTQITPNTLKTRCASAARRDCVLPVIAARFAVMVVPMFSPSTRAAPSSKLIHPLAHMMSVMAIVAADA